LESLRRRLTDCGDLPRLGCGFRRGHSILDLLLVGSQRDEQQFFQLVYHFIVFGCLPLAVSMQKSLTTDYLDGTDNRRFSKKATGDRELTIW